MQTSPCWVFLIMTREHLKNLIHNHSGTKERNYIAKIDRKKDGLILLKHVYMFDKEGNLTFVADHVWVDEKRSGCPITRNFAAINCFIFKALPRVYFENERADDRNKFDSFKYGFSVKQKLNFPKEMMVYLMTQYQNKINKNLPTKTFQPMNDKG